ncbi:ABC transporter ATP-binding protein [Phycicoccus sp. BSK3Z-2]|uniref:ABC transporter ATP-binding protein n=1 Tax=Phycicoccus avicenniae TaxID=2828860 RepID=A0A941D6S0_9MICO|nr:ABC transporter ATP-binding protein [Phycicoccus avicenniae]MBR7742885.1 ABC transporter ATP-binding protein [Phycicoccus avicenniae]
MSGDGTGMRVAVEGVHRTYGAGPTAVRALRGVGFTVRPGELVAVRGRSGSGKTTLLNVVGGLDRCDAGTVRLDDEVVTAMSDDDLLALRRGPVAHVFQSFGLVPVLTARENVGVPLRLRGTEPQERERRVGAVLDRVGLGGHGEHRPDELSGGQQQRVALARALVSRPRLLLADEPTGQLDSETGREVMSLIARLAVEESMTTVVTTHDPALLGLADRVLTIADGVVTDEG